jgi:PD-(D/E)XK nuclease superfamily protein
VRVRLSYSKPPLEHLSASAIAQLTTCPEQFRLRRILNIPESRGPDKFIGIVDHATLEDALRFKLRSGCDYELESIPRIYDLAWDSELLEEGEPEWYGEDPIAIHDNGELMAVLYHDQVTPSIKPTAIEERFEQDIPGVPVPVVGYADVVEHSRIIEKKTSKARVRTPKPQWLLQGRIYQLSYDDKPIEWHLTTRNKTPGIFTPETDEGLRLETSDRDSTVLIVQQAWGYLGDLWRRYGANHSWPLHGLTHPFQCGLCFAGPKHSGRCIAWGGEGYTA